MDHETLEATRGSGEEHYSDVHVRAGDVRVLTISGSGIALQIGRNLSEVNHTLHRITIYLMLIAAGGIARRRRARARWSRAPRSRRYGA